MYKRHNLGCKNISRINLTKKNNQLRSLECGGKMAMVPSSFPLNVDKIENNGIANSYIWQTGN